MGTVEYERLLELEELKVFLDAAEAAGTVTTAAIAEIAESHVLDELELDALHRELDRPGAGDDDRRAPAVPPRGRSPPVADGGSGGRAREADRARRRCGEAADDP